MPTNTAFLLATLSLAALCSPAAHAIELTAMPGVIASANACYLNPGCNPATDWSAAKIVDGMDYDLTGQHSWSAGGHGTQAAPQWVRLDFGSIYQLQVAELHFTYNGPSYAGFSNVYEFRTSLDGITWDVAASGTLIDSADASIRNNTWAWAAGTGPVAQFVEYRVIGGSHWAALGEMSVHGVAAAVPEPASAAMLLAGLAAAGLTARRRIRRGD